MMYGKAKTLRQAAIPNKEELQMPPDIKTSNVPRK
jgi:hypothetical protein